MNLRSAILMGLILMALAACGGRPPVTPPTEGDRSVGPVFVDQTELLSLMTYPVQVVLHVQGNLPDPCHKPVWSVTGPGSSGRIDVELHSEGPAEEVCIQLVAPLDVQIPLGTFQQGSYSVWLNGRRVGAISE
jgi:hypothetical protein